MVTTVSNSACADRLRQILDDPGFAAEISAAEIPVLMAELERITATLHMRMAITSPTEPTTPGGPMASAAEAEPVWKNLAAIVRDEILYVPEEARPSERGKVRLQRVEKGGVPHRAVRAFCKARLRTEKRKRWRTWVKVVVGVVEEGDHHPDGGV